MHYDFPYATPITTENEKEEVKKDTKLNDVAHLF